MRKSLDGQAQAIHTHTETTCQTDRGGGGGGGGGRRREIRSDAMRSDECMGRNDEHMKRVNYRSHVWISRRCTHLYVKPSPFLKSSVQLRPSWSANSALLSGLGKVVANVESLPSPIEPFTFDFRLVAPATSASAAATAAALLCAMPNGTFTLRQLMSTTTTTTTKVNK